MKQDILLSSLREGRYDAALTTLYGDTSAAKERAVRLVEIFSGSYPDAGRNAVLFSAPGRTELGGNHTDHQHGHVLCGSVDMDTLACAAPNGAQVIRLHSEGYAPMQITLDDLSPRESERNTTAALIRGVMARIAELGYPIGGFDACMTSNVLSGSGLSSSAAFEVLLGNIGGFLRIGRFLRFI